MIEKLLKAGADPNAHDGDVCSPLHGAAGHGHAEVAKLLLDFFKADPMAGTWFLDAKK